MTKTLIFVHREKNNVEVTWCFQLVLFKLIVCASRRVRAQKLNRKTRKQDIKKYMRKCITRLCQYMMTDLCR